MSHKAMNYLRVAPALICEWENNQPVMSHKGISHVIHIMNHVPQRNESCPTKEQVMFGRWVMSHTRVCACVWVCQNLSRNVTQRNEPCSTYYESYHTQEWVMSHKVMSHVPQRTKSCPTKEWVMSHKGMSHVWQMSHVSHTCVCMCVCVSKVFDAHTRKWFGFASGSCIHTCVSEKITTSHVTQKNESCPTKEWVLSYILGVMSHKGMSHVPQRNESCHAKEWVMSHKGMSHVPQSNEACPTKEWGMSYKSRVISHESCHAKEWVMSHKGMSHDPQRNEACPTNHESFPTFRIVCIIVCVRENKQWVTHWSMRHSLINESFSWMNEWLTDYWINE